MFRLSLPILAWVVIGLAVVGLLPFVVTWYQIDQSRDGIIAQTQQTQQILARSTADRIAGRVALLERSLAAAGDTEALYQDPNSAEAEKILEQLFLADADLMALSLLTYRSGQAQEIKSLRRSGVTFRADEFAAGAASEPPGFVTAGGQPALLLHSETTRPQLVLVAVVDSRWIAEWLTPLGVDEGELVLIDGAGQRLAGSQSALERIPPEKQSDLLLPTVLSGNSSFQQGELPVVYGFSKVGNLDWRVVSSQSARKAETATEIMRRTARNGFWAVAAIVSLLSLAAWYFIVRPIRSIVADYGVEEQQSGGEIAQLLATFERLEQQLNERDQVDEFFVDRYQIIRRIGVGAMGTVYLARDPKLNRQVALKTIRIDRRLGPKKRQELVDSLLQEGVTGAGLTHPNVVTVYDVIGDEQGAFIVMEYVEGASLEALIDRQLRLPPEAVVEIARGVLKALQLAHDNGLVHRDVKPANILIAKNGTVKLTDFGIAAAVAGTGDNRVMGTPGYLAPECYDHARYNARTDLFAMGVVMAEALTGQAAFAGRRTQQIISRTRSREVSLPLDIESKTPEALRVLIRRLLEKRPDDRPSDAHAALEVLQEIDVNETVLSNILQLPDSQLPLSANKRRRLSNAATAQVDRLGSRRDH